jgi:hypothetical protein
MCGYKKRYNNLFFPSSNFGSGIRDKHPGSATLLLPFTVPFYYGLADIFTADLSLLNVLVFGQAQR